MAKTYPTPIELTAAEIAALDDTVDEPTGLDHFAAGIGSSSSPTLLTLYRQRQSRMYQALALAFAGLVAKEGTAGVASLKVGVFPLDYVLGGVDKEFDGATDQSCADDDVNYVYIDSSNALQIVTDATGWPADKSSYVPLAEVTCASGDITGVQDRRLWAHAVIPPVDSVGDGLDLSAGQITIDVSDFAGEGVEDDGAENLRVKLDGATIARSASGVKVSAADLAGDGLQADGDTVEVDASQIAGAGLEDDGSENLRVAAGAAGDGLQGGGGSALAVDVSEFAGEGVEDDGAENIRVKLDGATIARSASGVKVGDNVLDGRQAANVGANGGLPVIFTATLTGGNTVVIHNSNAPFKYRIIDAWSVAASGDGGSWYVDDGTNAVTDTVTVTGTDKTVDRASQVDDAYSEIAANGSLRVVGDGANADVEVYVMAVRVS